MLSTVSCLTTKTVKKPAGVAKVAPPPAIELSPQVDLPQDTCVEFTTLGSEPPVYIEELGFVVSTVQKPCITYEGKKGFYRDSSWVAMGIPCSGGGGKIEWKGKAIRPRIVSFILSTDCPMTPQLDAIAEFGASNLGFDHHSKLLAYNPFILQFWSIPGFPDAGTGFTVDLRSRSAIDTLWAKLKKQETINVHLYGRENAWIGTDDIYFINASIVGITQHEFRLELLEVKVLSIDEIAAARKKCDLLRPKRGCHLIF